MSAESFPTVIALGFEGVHRVGKGTQMDMLSERLDTMNVPNLQVRGDGSKEAQWGSDHPDSMWWNSMTHALRGPDATPEHWQAASIRLTHEMRYLKQEVLPSMATDQGSQHAAILIDRSVISRMMIPLERGQLDTDSNLDDLYRDPQLPGFELPSFAPEIVGRPVDNNAIDTETELSFQDAMPDTLFLFDAPIGALLRRLDDDDPKLRFRARNIVNCAHLYPLALGLMPDDLRDQVVNISGVPPAEHVHRAVVGAIARRHPDLLNGDGLGI
ncbi:MAG: hypothetical protein KIH63_000080 [Candidatus Saccharibacteria bacterium]|nr:hypothetical protein [Candidatus Saccharibacteria bacterium]